MNERPVPIWEPDPAVAQHSAIARFARVVAERHRVDVDDYHALQRWSVFDLDGFWSAVWDFFDVQADGEPTSALALERMPGAVWFPGVRVNYAEHVLRYGIDRPDDLAVTEVAEDGTTRSTSWGELRAQVGALTRWLRELGVEPGDRVIGYLPNTTPALVAMLATVSLGAIWSACAQDYSAAGAAARFGQLEPVVLFAADGYRWNGTIHDRRAEVTSLQDALPSLRTTVHVTNVGLGAPPDATTFDHAVAEPAPPVFTRVPFDTAMWVLFSSGTTGKPKGIVHAQGGILLGHLAMIGLHLDVGPDAPLFWYTTTNWMMWNVVASALLVGAPIVVYDGSPAWPDPTRLWQIAADAGVAALGVSPGYLQASIRAELHPGRDLDLSRLRSLPVTGAPLAAGPYTWVRDEVSPRVQVGSTSGGTDVMVGFAGSTPTTPVWPGELSAPALGVALEAWDSDGHPVVGKVGELVVTRPMPSMPATFWDDPGGRRMHDAYFGVYPGVWRHGDWVTLTAHGSVIVSGRSDSTLNRNGVRLGSADIYDVVDTLPEVAESLVIGAEIADGSYWLVLFVVLADGVELTPALGARVKAAIRSGASPRHVPDDVVEVPALPHTRTGKKLEVPVKRIIQGHPLDQVAARDAVDDYTALTQFTRFARTTRSG